MKTIQIHQTGASLREAARNGSFADQTAGQAPDYLQGNVVILPREYAQDFLVYCLNNPKPCPLIGISKPGDPTLPGLGEIDIRTDVPLYRIFRDGELAEEVRDISAIWNDNLVSFVLGCSFTFEEALQRNGYEVRHLSKKQNVPMFRTNIETMPGGVFGGPLVVTMRSYPESQIPAIFEISARYKHAHGAPIYWGDPKKIGITDLGAPDYGEPIDVPKDEVPIFWACGVTSQAALERVRPSLSITHAPGCMLVCDLKSTANVDVNPLLVSSTGHCNTFKSFDDNKGARNEKTKRDNDSSRPQNYLAGMARW